MSTPRQTKRKSRIYLTTKMKTKGRNAAAIATDQREEFSFVC
jgi:hypothetical protein